MSGDFYVTSEVDSNSTTDRIFRIDVAYNDSEPVSAVATSLTTTTPIINPEGLVVIENVGSAYGNKGDLIIAEDIASGRIIHVTPAGHSPIRAR